MGKSVFSARLVKVGSDGLFEHWDVSVETLSDKVQTSESETRDNLCRRWFESFKVSWCDVKMEVSEKRLD